MLLQAVVESLTDTSTSNIHIPSTNVRGQLLRRQTAYTTHYVVCVNLRSQLGSQSLRGTRHDT